MRLLVAVAVLLASCAPPPAVVGWQGTDVHLVDGTWLGTERACGAGEAELECRIVVEKALAAVPSNLRATPTKALVAALPTVFAMASGETIAVPAFIGLTTFKAVVVDLADGSRRVVGLSCYLPYYGEGRHGLAVEMATCDLNALDYWSNQHELAWVPPGRHFP